MTKRVVIIGGGFSGTALAIHLARQTSSPLAITVVEPRAALAQGVAYSTSDPAHRINVPAEKMQLSAAEQGDFDRWYRQQTAYTQDTAARWTDGSVYPQRGAFARYIAEKFVEAQRYSPATLSHLRDEAIALRDNHVLTRQGQLIAADAVVLAVSHPPPALPGMIARSLAGHPGLIADPWRPDALEAVKPSDRIAIIGSGLTMADNVASLQLRGHAGPIIAFSRHGLLPRPNANGAITPWPLAALDDLTLSLNDWTAYIRSEIARAAEQGTPWQAVLDTVRANGQRIWSGFSLAEQRRFLRHLRAWWDVHRYRIAPQVSQLLEQKQQQGALQVLAARLRQAASEGDAIRLRLSPRHGAPRDIRVDKLIVTTGPAHGGLLESQPLLRELAANGELQADPLQLGILVNAHSQTINQAGEANPRLLVVGPAARGRFGELMGLPQVAEHAEAVAQQLLATVLAPQQEGRCLA
ncbi:FAD-dependent oxidoreductase [Paramixta manurensis]|uniref:FAD-dependent oxidoreductase n=1 Tax=Paramixta manurensis TaxID=2740817 RepID=A0A6M8UC86_9GAMM|nr:FAD-dependent oxidoreductase [Erwiniaceae bacterium PD-1]